MMKHVAAASVLILFASGASAWAQDQEPIQHVQLKSDDGPQQPGLISCFYNASGTFTGSDSAQPNAQPGGPYQTGDGDYSWSYNIAAPNGQSCPRTRPGS